MPDLLNTSDVPLAPTGRTTETVLPDWYTNYAMQILANQGALSATPYTTYGGPRVADFTPDQRAAFDQARTGAASFNPDLSAAETATGGALQRSGLSAAQPWLTAAGGMSGVTAATPNLSTGAGYLAASTSPTGISLASPFLSGGALSSVSNIKDYMDPYNEAVVSRIGELGNRNLTEKLLPAIGDQFVSAGGYGGTRQAETIGRAVRDTQEGISAAQSGALSQGYQSAEQASAADKARLAGLAGTAGTLGLGQQGALATAGSGTANIGATLGSLTADQQRILASLGVDVGNLTNTDTANQLATAQQLAALAKQRQEQTLTGAGALQSIGQQQQAQTQTSLDTAYQDFLRQQGYDQTQIDAMTKTLSGVQGAVPKAVLETGYGPAPTTPDPSPSTAQTISSLIGAWLLGQGRSG